MVVKIGQGKRVMTQDVSVIYPDSDRKPMADNTNQFEWMALLKWGLEDLFAGEELVFVAGDLLWYPVEGHPTIRVAPDVFVAFGRPKGYRGSYIQHREAGVAPQVAIEILSESNTTAEMQRKRGFYERYGVEEFYIYDPETFAFEAYHKLRDGKLHKITAPGQIISPRLGISFDAPGTQAMRVFRPDGRQLRKPDEALAEVREREEAAQETAVRERARADKLAAQLRALGIEPETL